MNPSVGEMPRQDLRLEHTCPPVSGLMFCMRVAMKIGGYICLLVLIGVGLRVSNIAHAQSGSLGPHLDSSGWTEFSRRPDTRVFYVSTSVGNDANSGSSETKPVKTIAKGMSLLRNGSPDWLLLKKGDTWANEAFGYVRISGRSAREPMLISSYGEGPRPLIKTSSAVADTGIGSLGGAGRGGDFLALVGIEFYAHTRDPKSPQFINSTAEHNGTRFLNPSTWLLIEDCKFTFYEEAVDFDGGPAQSVTIRRNVIADSYSTKSHAQGLYAENVVSLVVEENIFDHNGWNADVKGAEATIFNHNIYLQGTVDAPNSVSGPAILKGNIIANASSHGAQVRPGGSVTGNLFVHNPIGMNVFQRASTISDNVFMSGNDINASLRRGFGIDVAPSKGPINITHNIIAHKDSNGLYGHGIVLLAGTTRVTATNNIIYQWDDPIVDHGVGNVTSPNDINLSGYSDPARTVQSYNVSLGGAPALSDFLSEARKQSKDNWRPQFTADAVNKYIWAGFGRP